MCFDTVIKILAGRAPGLGFIFEQLQNECAYRGFMLQDIVLSPCLPLQEYFKPHIPCSGDNCVALCTLRRPSSSQDCLCSGPQTWVCGITGLQWKYCPGTMGGEMELEVGWEALLPRDAEACALTPPDVPGV